MSHPKSPLLLAGAGLALFSFVVAMSRLAANGQELFDSVALSPQTLNDGNDDSMPSDREWTLRRDYKIDAQLNDAPQDTVTLTVVRESRNKNRLLGSFSGNKDGTGKPNDSIFTGETTAREGNLLILRQELPVTQFVGIHVGHRVSANEFRGTWHDNAGQSGDFDLKLTDNE